MENFCQNGKIELRREKDLYEVLGGQPAESSTNRVVYKVCRGEKQTNDLRYDITEISPLVIGGEFPKTFGHKHGGDYAELFEVLEGSGLVLMQKEDGKHPENIAETYLIITSPGNKVVIPPHFSFANINTGNNRLLISNWIYVNVKNVYEDLKQKHGLCWYVMQNEKEGWSLQKNKNYKDAPKPIVMRPKAFPPQLENLDFLNEPAKYAQFLTIDSLYKRE